jgi:ElaB/YqjD/DUF883 family membrane-anchored ribosome-binding protein
VATQTKTSATQAQNAANSAKDVSIDDLSAQLELLKADIAELTSTMGDYARSKKDKTQASAKRAVDDLAETGREKALETQLQAEEFIRTQPATALGIAAGIGFLVGLVTARR